MITSLYASAHRSGCLRIQLFLSWWFVGECGMEGLLEEEVICFAQYFGVASRCQIYNQLLAQLWNWLLSKAPFWLSGYVVLVVVELCLNPWKTWVLWLIISVIMWKFISRLRLSLKSKSTCHYVTVWCIWFVVFKGRTNLREYWQWSAQGSSFLCVVTVALVFVFLPLRVMYLL